MPKFNVFINAVLVGSILAENAHDAVDAARDHHIDPLSETIPVTPPDEGGDFEFVLTSDAPWVDTAGKTQPAGVVSSFTERHEPQPHVREAVEAAAAEAEAARLKAEERAQIESEFLAKLQAEHPELAAKLATNPKGESK